MSESQTASYRPAESSQPGPSTSLAVSRAGSIVYRTRENQRVPEVREPAAVYEVDTEPAVDWPWADGVTKVHYSIRIPRPAGMARCARCQVRFSAAGPTGYAEDKAVCDMCLLEGSQGLGMVMALVAVVRAFGSVQPLSQEDYKEALRELGAFARIYERFAAKTSPPRIFRIPGFGAER